MCSLRLPPGVCLVFFFTVHFSIVHSSFLQGLHSLPRFVPSLIITLIPSRVEEWTRDMTGMLPAFFACISAMIYLIGIFCGLFFYLFQAPGWNIGFGAQLVCLSSGLSFTGPWQKSLLYCVQFLLLKSGGPCLNLIEL